MKKNILIIGAGAIGAFYGGILSRSKDVSVSVVTRTLAETIREHGFLIKSSLGDRSFFPTNVYESTFNIHEKYDYVFVTTKVFPSIDVVSLLQPVVSKETVIVLIQNGIHIEHPIYDAFPQNVILSGLAFICVSREASGVVTHQDYGRLVLGRYPKGDSFEADWLQSQFKEQGLSCNVSSNVNEDRWKKLIWNAPFNPLSVLANKCDTASLLHNQATLELVKAIMKEVQLAAKADGVSIDDSFISKNIDDTAVMKPYKTSMLLDVEGNRSIEREAILGNCIRFSEKKGIDVPIMKTLYALLSHF